MTAESTLPFTHAKAHTCSLCRPGMSPLQVVACRGLNPVGLKAARSYAVGQALTCLDCAPFCLAFEGNLDCKDMLIYLFPIGKS